MSKFLQMQEQCIHKIISSFLAFLPVSQLVKALLKLLLSQHKAFQVNDHASVAVLSDWIGAVEASYVPVQVCDNLWIIPTEHQIQDASACNILMRPGMAFGTGELMRLQSFCTCCLDMTSVSAAQPLYCLAF